MGLSQIYILIGAAVFIIIIWAVLLIRKQEPNLKITQLDSLSFTFIITGIMYGENTLLSYFLLGIGIVLIIFNIFKKRN